MSPASSRTRFRRKPQRGSHDRALIDSILDEALIAHLGIVDEGRPLVVPTLHARIGDLVYIHGSSASRTLGAIGSGAQVCLTVSLLDGLVLAQTAFRHSVNYRSAVLFGEASYIEGEAEKRSALQGFVEQLVPGRWPDVQPPSPSELRATAVLALPIDEASAKVRSGPPHDEGDNSIPPPWTGVLPLRLKALPPRASEQVPVKLAAPPYLRQYARPTRSTGA